jgi:hypothetical protein
MQTIIERGQFLRDWLKMLEARIEALRPPKAGPEYSWCGYSIGTDRAKSKARREMLPKWKAERPALSKALSQVKLAIRECDSEKECGMARPEEYWQRRIGKFIVPCS